MKELSEHEQSVMYIALEIQQSLLISIEEVDLIQ